MDNLPPLLIPSLLSVENTHTHTHTHTRTHAHTHSPFAVIAQKWLSKAQDYFSAVLSPEI